MEGSEIGERGVADLTRVRQLVLAAGAPEGALRVDPGVARGLDYYTGIVLEAQLDALPDIGSVGSGGRYDDLAGLYTKARLPGVGCSLGISRLLDAMEALEKDAASGPSTQVMITHPAADLLESAFQLAAALRGQGLSAEVYPESKKHGAQMRYADRRDIPYVVTLDNADTFHAKRMADGETHTVSSACELAAWLKG